MNTRLQYFGCEKAVVRGPTTVGFEALELRAGTCEAAVRRVEETDDSACTRDIPATRTLVMREKAPMLKDVPTAHYNRPV